MLEPIELERRLQRMEDIDELRQLVAKYGQLVDDRDIGNLAELYTNDAIFDSQDGPLAGRDQVLEYYRRRLASYGVTYHYPHSHIIDITSDNEARGTVHAHAELAINGAAFIVALRYTDQYRREDGRWRFHHRKAQQLYALPFANFAEQISDVNRKCWPGSEPGPADIPEGIPSWERFWYQQDEGSR